MNLELHQNLTETINFYWEKYTPILQKELEIEGLLPQNLLEKGACFINKLLDLQLETKNFNSFKEKIDLIHTTGMCFQIDNKETQFVCGSIKASVEKQHSIFNYIESNIKKFRNKEENTLLCFDRTLPYKSNSYVMLFGHTYLDSNTQSLWIFVYDFNFHFTPETNHIRNISYFNLKLLCNSYYSDEKERILDLDEKNFEKHVKETFPNLISRFRNIIGLTLKEYHFHQRMNLVLQKLYFENKSIKEIAFDLNYNSDNTLYGDIGKHFKHNSSEIKRYNYIKIKDI